MKPSEARKQIEWILENQKTIRTSKLKMLLDAHYEKQIEMLRNENHNYRMRLNPGWEEQK